MTANLIARPAAGPPSTLLTRALALCIPLSMTLQLHSRYPCICTSIHAFLSPALSPSLPCLSI